MFKDVKNSVNVKTGSGLKKGDVLLDNGHVVMYIGSGKIVYASISEFGKITGRLLRDGSALRVVRFT